MRRIFFGLAMASAVFFSAQVKAADKGIYELGEIGIRTTAEDAAAAAGSVIYRDQFVSAGANDVADAIRMMPGATYSVGTRNEKMLYIRGFDQRQVPVFFDGIPVSLPYDGYVDMSKFSLSSIGMIEIQTGAPSVQFGSNALGGAVNLVSRKPVKAFEAELVSEYGRDGFFSTELMLGTKLNNFYAVFSGEYEEADGWIMSDDYTANSKEDGGERENSDHLSKSSNVKIGFQPTSDSEISLGYNYINSEWGLPHGVGSSTRYWRMNDWDKKTIYLIADKTTSDYGIKFRVYRDEYYNVIDSYDNASYSTQTTRKAFHSTYDDYSEGAVLGFTTKIIPANTISASFQYRKDQHKSQGNYNEPWLKYEAKTYYAGLEDNIALSKKAALILGLAYDVNDPTYADIEDGTSSDELRDSISTLSPKARLVYKLSDKSEVHASAAQTTRFPTLKELYSTFIDGDYVENPDLEEEKSVNYEIGVKHALTDSLVLQANLFYSDVKDLIQDGRITIDGTTYDQKQNVDKAKIKGFEVFLNGTIFKKDEITLSYTFSDAKNTSPDRESDILNDRPRHMFFAGNKYNFTSKIYAAANLMAESARFDSQTDNEIGGIWTADIKAGYKPVKNVIIEVGADNVLDRNYQLADGFPREGAYYYTKLSLKL